jgi:uncharacterized RDD family membrane protein YckC
VSEGSHPATPNPYAPPATGWEVPRPAPVPDGTELASRWRRLGGSLVDGLLHLVAAAPLAIGGAWSLLGTSINSGDSPLRIYANTGLWGATSAALTLGLLAVNCLLIARRGQSLGKIAAGTRIVNLDGTPTGAVHGILLRTLLPYVVGFLPHVGSWIGIIDILFIFRGDRRCLHDLIAGTKVVRLPPASYLERRTPWDS